jgi:hypothetical protein
MKRKKKIRWIVVCLVAAGLFGIGAIRLFVRQEIVGGVIYGTSSIIFVVLAYAYYKEYLK